MGVDERNTNDMIKTDAFARRMPSHRGQKPARRRPEQALSAEKPTPQELTKEAIPAEDSLEIADVTVEKVETALISEPPVMEEAVEPTAEVEAAAETETESEVEVAEDTGTAPDEEAADDTVPEENVETADSDSADEEAEQPERDAKAVEKPAAKKTDAKEAVGKIGKGFSSFVKSHKQLTAILATVLLLVIVLIILFASAGAKSRKSDNYMDQIRNQEIKLNDVAAIDDFFVSYYTGLSSGNTTELEAMFDDPEKANITTEISTIVNQYDNFKVYVTPGIEENDIVAFVGNDIHFANIDATAPSVDSFYLKYDKEAAALKICADMYTDQNILKYMNLVSYREPIRSLLTDTNNRLSDALAGNKDLNNLYILMQSMTESAELEPGAEETTAEE